MNAIGLAQHEFHYEQRAFRRDPMAVFATVGLPLLYMVIFVTLFGSETLDFTPGGQPGPLKAGTVMTANFIAIGVISAAFYNLAVKLVESRESGELKRFRATPLPTSSFIGGHVGVAIGLSAGVAAVLAVLGRLAYGVPVPLSTLPAFALAVLVGAVAFACLGFAFTVVVRKAGAAVALGLGLTLTLFFLSGNFFVMPDEDWPTAIRVIAAIFPVKHLNDALLTALNPHSAGMGIAAGDLGVVLLWGLAGLLVAVRWFRWTPSTG
jgi:ABC-2 type transport system permease protein